MFLQSLVLPLLLGNELFILSISVFNSLLIKTLKIMELKKSQRNEAKLRLSLQGSPGVGKSYSGLLIAFGMTGDWSKIAVIDTERGSANLYSHLGSYYVLNLEEPFTPEKYISGIKLCEQSGIEVIIIDSISHEWSGKGGCLEIHEKTTSAMKIPNSFTAWATVTPLHQAFIDAILQSSCHIISTIRTKTEYVINERNGRMAPQKLGLSPVTRDGFEYEVTVSLEIDDEHNASCSKDRTGLFADKGKFRITSETGKLILDWINSATPSFTSDDVKGMIKTANTMEKLNELYKGFPEWHQLLTPDFSKRKQEILTANLRNLQNFGNNGTPTSKIN